MRKLKCLLRPLKDPRADNTRHDLVDIVIIALAATLSGARSCTEFEFFGYGRLELLRRFLELRHGIPSHGTFSNVLRALDPKGLDAVLRKFSKGFGIKGVVSIDGKALCGAFTRGRKATPLHMVNVWAAGMRMALAQRKAPNRNEIAGALEILALLDLDGAIVTADALHCRPRHGAGHPQSEGALCVGDQKQSRQALQGGRFPDIAAVGRIDCWRSDGSKTAKHTVRYFLASRLLPARSLLEIVRAHWSIENNLHWVLDVLLDEDACRSRKDHAAENLALIRKLALNFLQATPDPARISHRILKTKWDNDFLLTALGHMR